MKTILRAKSLISGLLFILLIIIFPACKKNTSGRRPGGSNIKLISDVRYGSNKDWQGNNVDLLLDVYIPPNQDPTQKFPLVFFVHGGGFVDGDKGGSAELMRNFASSNYVGVTINYRLGWTHPTACEGDTTECKEAVYRAIQDARAAMRFVVAHAREYQIDTNYIFLSGGSAGAVTVLNAHFMTQDEIDLIIPGVQSKLGGLNNADNSLTNTYTVQGIGAVSGCLGSADFINSSNAVPVIFFHGENDIVIPYNTGTSFDCPNMLAVDGSLPLYNKLIALGEPAVLHVDPNGGHGVYDDEFRFTNQLCFFNSVMSKRAESGYFEGETTSCR